MHDGAAGWGMIFRVHSAKQFQINHLFFFCPFLYVGRQDEINLNINYFMHHTVMASQYTMHHTVMASQYTMHHTVMASQYTMHHTVMASQYTMHHTVMASQYTSTIL